MRMISVRIVLFACFLASAHVALGAPVMTPLQAEKQGFQFVNSFANDFVPALDIRTGGLCGGMSYSALDYYWRKMVIPNQNYRPANKSTLQQYLYNRQVDSIVSNIDRWVETGFNPGGVRNLEFFNWGLQAGPGKRITELRSFIDQGKPVVIGLEAAGTGAHQMVAVGYDMGRYTGNLGSFKEDFKIFVYDPNNPGKRMTLIPRFSDLTYTLAENDKMSWRTYFVDAKYATKSPPALPNPAYPNDGLIRELLLQFFTGNDDLRGGNDNVNVVVTYKTGPAQGFSNVNLGSRWLSNYEETARIVLPAPVPLAALNSIIISTTFTGGIGGDNWDMAKLLVRAIAGGHSQYIAQTGYKRFTGIDKNLFLPLNVGPVIPMGYAGQLTACIKTGGDDLRGGNDNLNVTVFFRDGDRQTFNNVNGSGRWADNSEKYETFPLKKAVKVENIIQVTLSTTFGGGIGGDNWNMNSIELRAEGTDVNTKIGAYGFKRFTGSDKTLNILTAPMK